MRRINPGGGLWLAVFILLGTVGTGGAYAGEDVRFMPGDAFALTARLEEQLATDDFLSESLLVETPPPSRLTERGFERFAGAGPSEASSVPSLAALDGPRAAAPSPTVAPAVPSVPFVPSAPFTPGPAIAEFAADFRAARAAEDEARAIALRDPAEVTDAELRRLTDAILAYEKIAAAADSGEANSAAWHGVARCEYRIGRLWAANRALQKSYPETLDLMRVTARVSLQSMIADALFARGHGRVAGGWGEGDAARRRGVTGYRAAREVYEAVVVNDRLHPRAARALLRYGICSLEIGELDAAEGAFRQVAAEYARGESVFEARVRLAETLLRRHRHTPELPTAVEMEVESLLAAAGYDDEAVRRFRLAPDSPAVLPGLAVGAPPTAAERASLDANAREQFRALDAMLAQGPVTAAPSAFAYANAPATDYGVAASALQDGAGGIARATAEREEIEAAKILRQAQIFLRQSTKRARESARYQLREIVERFPAAPSAEVARSLLARHFKE